MSHQFFENFSLSFKSLIARLGLLCILNHLVIFPSFAVSNELNDSLQQQTKIRLWHKNTHSETTLAFLRLALENALPSNKIQFDTVTIENNDEAFVALEKNDLSQRVDIIVSAISKERENRYLPIFVPLDRGLLGFRICMVLPSSTDKFKSVNSVVDFQEQTIKLTLVEAWPDVSVMKSNGIPLQLTANYAESVQAIKSQNADCFSRSVMEIDTELAQLPALAMESRIALIYPLADIIYVNPNLPELHATLELGISTALEDGSFYRLADEHYDALLQKHRFYSRKLLIMQNPDVSEEALEAINRYGIASFIQLRKKR